MEDRWFVWTVVSVICAFVLILSLSYKHDLGYARKSARECSFLGGHVIRIRMGLLCVTPDGRIITAY